MKRLLALAALALAASACTTNTNTSTGAGNTNTNANANANTAAASPTPAGPTQADIEARERQLLDAIRTKNWDAFAGMLADNCILVGADGVLDKTQTLEVVRKYDLTEYTLSDQRLLKLDADLVILIYTMNEKSSYDGKPVPPKPFRASSAWANRGGNWVNVYHQETEVEESPAASPTPAATASPATSPATTAAPAASPSAPASATEAERAVYETFKAKNYDAFAAYLLPDAVEVAPAGVYDKATSVKNAAMIDAAKTTTSEFKETKLGADATLLTYKAVGPARGKTVEMYHSTIWTNRGGQWKAAFHQGTYIVK